MKFLTQTLDQVPEVINGSWQDVIDASAEFKNGIVKVEKYERAKEISLQMIRWWKGVLLPALSKETGNSISWWETMIKLNVNPDYFKPFVVTVNGMAVTVLPSIANMPLKQALALVEGSVEWLHDNGFLWVTLPASELRTT